MIYLKRLSREMNKYIDDKMEENIKKAKS